MREAANAALREIKAMHARFGQIGAMDAPALSRELFTLARELARSGAFGNWSAVKTRLIQLGFAEVELLAPPELVAEIGALCARYYAGSSYSD
jgi:hypothetical protein